MNETEAWIKNVVQVQLPDIPSSGLGELLDSKESKEFLQDMNTISLYISYSKKSQKAKFSNDLDIYDEEADYLLLTKLKPCVVTLDNIGKLVRVLPINNSITNELYQNIHSVYSRVMKIPALKVDNKIQKLLLELEDGLALSLQKSNSDKPDSKISLASINSFGDEILYWTSVAQKSNEKTTQGRAAFFREQFSVLKPDFDRISSLTFDDLLELVEKCHDVLDEIWRQQDFEEYPQERMRHLLSIVTDDILNGIQNSLSKYDVINDSVSNVLDPLRCGLQVCENLISTFDTLTVRLWPNVSTNRWDGEPFTSLQLINLAERLKSILHVRTTNELLLDLLDENEKKELFSDNAIKVFQSISPLACSSFAESRWKTALETYNEKISIFEIKAATKLQSILSELLTQPSQLLREFQKYKDIIRKKTISQKLDTEKEVLLGQLMVGLKSISTSFNNRLSLNEKPDYVGNISWSKQVLGKLHETDVIVTSLLGSKKNYESISKSLNEDITKYEKEQFESWVSDIQAMVDDGEGDLNLEKSGRLMQLNFETGKLSVNYGDKLVTLLRETRQMLSMGFSVPSFIRALADNGQKYYRHGVVLKQVANFYNTIDQQMLPCQQAMLLSLALEFEKIVKAPMNEKSNTITWSNPQDLEAYVGKLQYAAEKLTSENTKLRKCHTLVMDHIKSLMGTDLVNQQPKWKETMANIRSIVDSVIDVKPENSVTWKNHIDYQLYKALEFQYQLGLESLSSTLPEINVDLIYKQDKIQFRPSFEEVRAKYYRDMKRFINLPSSFKPLGETKIFLNMVENNSKSLLSVYKKADSLFLNLSKVQDMFAEWVILGSVDLEAFIETSLIDIEDYEFNFRMLKQKGKESEQLPSIIQVGCISVSTTPIKAAIDDLLQKLFDALLNVLKSGVNQHLSAIEQFTTMAMDMLALRPQSMAEIGNANAIHSELSKNKGKISAHFENAELKNKLLKSVAGAGVDTSVTRAKWSKLELILESHELMIKEQVDILRGAIDSRIVSFFKEVEKFSSRWNHLKPKPSEVSKFEADYSPVTFVNEKLEEFKEIEKGQMLLIEDCGHFGIDPPSFSVVDELKKDLYYNLDIWKFRDDFVTGLKGFADQDWITFRTKVQSFEDFLTEWNDKARTGTMDIIRTNIIKDIDGFKGMVPVLKYLRGDSWMSEHWGELFRILSFSKSVNISELNFGHFLAAKIEIAKNATQISELNARANGEISIREAMQELDVWGASAVFQFSEYQDAKEIKVKLIKEWKETLTQVGDNLSLLQSLKDSPYFKAFAEKASIWEKKLSETDEYLRTLNNVQRKWVYLEPIFSRGALPAEQSRFDRIDGEFRSIMSSVAKDPRVTSIVSYPGIRKTLSTLSDQLERCQKALNEFLELKRSKFARFYFLGDEDLLEILGQSKNPEVIQSHLKKLFAGVHSVKFNEKCTHVVAMSSIQGEIVPLKKPVQITLEVEVWLQTFANEMSFTLAALLKEYLSSTDIFKFPTQIVALAEYLRFTERTEKSIKDGDYNDQLGKLKAQLDSYTSFDIHSIKDKTERNIAELKLKSLILDVIHFISVIEKLKADNIKTLDSWAWQQQLRFYLNSEKRCIIKMHDAEFNYTYEYQGIPPKLVHTPLTDKCYLTLTQAMSNGFGGNPFGPAGTGKTESVKALGVLFGRQVLVFNCDEGIDYKSMGRLFVGIVKCGAWGCFDEFNRLEEAVLSAVSQQIQVIQASLKKKESVVTLLGKSIDLDANSGIFVTLNPAGKGYGGRQRLPDNLKQLFRSVAMTHPDLELISEVILLSEGFQEGKVLGSKVVSIFTLAKQFLTPQQHYDWGLRPLKAVLSLAGTLMHDQQKEGTKKTDESLLIVKALTASIVSKLTFVDSKRFNMLIKDIFPNVEFQDIVYESLKKAVEESYKELNLIYLESQAEKIYQLFEASRQRMGIVLVGPSGSGKSTIWKLFSKAWNKLGQRLVIHKSNPKAVDRKTLLGHMDMDTREWTDGILTFASRQAVKEPLESHSWIICDGDVDPEWVESLNSVLDDNRLLTMPNGERIQFGPNINFIFETHDLSFASPATVSRMGMIYLSDETLDAAIIIEGWLQKRPENLRAKLKMQVEDFLMKAVNNVRQNYSLVVETTKAGLIFNALSHVQDATDKLSFLYGLIRGIGSNLLMESRLKFANEVLEMGHEKAPDSKKTMDYFVADNGKLELYQKTEPEGIGMDAMNDLDRLPVVETPDLKRNMDVLMPWLKSGHPILVVGPEGAGKSTTLRHCFSRLKNTNVAIVHCSSQTKSKHVLQRLYQSCIATNTTQGRVLKPKDCENLVLYLKDINLPSPDKYATVELIQFLQQLLTYRGFFDSSLEWISIENIQLVASMNPSSTMGRHKLSTRFTSIVRICYLTYSEKEQLQSIYKIFLKPVIDKCLPDHPVWSLPKNISKLASTMTSVYEQTSQKFTVDMCPHYIFSPRDLSRIVMSLARYVYQGKDEKELLEIVSYEFERMFQDRLVGTESSQRFQSIIQPTIRTDWNLDINIRGTVFTSNGSIQENLGLMGSFIDDYATTVKQKLVSYEREVQELNLDIFPELLEQIAKIERGLSQSGGCLLLAGRPGIQYHKLVAFSSYFLNYKILSPKASNNYSLKSFQNDLKQALQTAAIESSHVVFAIEDFQMTKPAFLEIVNSLLSGSEVGGIYSPEEIEGVANQLKDAHSQEGFRGTIYEFFMSKIRKFLHLVIIFDSASSDFVPRCESNPALYTRCQFIWQDRWSIESMNHIIKSAFANPTLSGISDQVKVGEELLAIHQSCLSNGATPKSFIEFIKLYGNIYNQKKELMQKKQNYLSGGLKKLSEAAAFVDKLSTDAKEQQILLAKKQKEADSALKEITEKMVTAAEQKKEMEALTEQLADEEVKLVVRKQAVELELAEVEPIIKSAKAAVGEIRSESLSEIRSLRAPPPAIRDVLEAVLRLMGNLDMSWNSMKGFLGQRTVKEEIMNFDVRSISKSTREAVAEMINQKSNSFEESVIKRASVAAAPLAMWVKANIQYATVVEKVAPLENDLKRLVSSLDESKARVAQLKSGLDAIDKKVEDLRDEFGLKTREAESLRVGLERAVEIMTRAKELLEKLSGEGQRWNVQFKDIEGNLKNLPRNALLSAAFVIYLGSAPEDVRQQYVSKWLQISNSLDQFRFTDIMSSESERLVWKSQGLPADALSNENAIILINNMSTSLLIDTSGQSTEWLKVYLKDRKPEVVNQADDNFVRSLELAVRFGKTLIVQDVTDIDPILYPLIRRTLVKQGPRYMVELGEKVIDYNDDFRLYLVTKRANFSLPSNAVGLVTDINFTITRAGLAGQLLGLTLQHERPQLEVQKLELLKKEEEFKIKLVELEEQLLNELASSEGNILENKSLIQSLNDAKEKSTTVSASLAESKAIQDSLDLERQKYSPISKFGSVLYFVIHDLRKLNNMYQFSLATYLQLFNDALSIEANDADTEARNSAVMVALEKLVYNYISRSIFKSDRHTFAIYMVHALHPKMFEANEWELFLGRLILSQDNEDKKREVPSWIPSERQAQFKKLRSALPNLCNILNFNDSETWKRWVRDPSCEVCIPRDTISPFQKLLVVQTFRPDRLLSSITNFCMHTLSLDSLSPPSLSLSTLYEKETDSTHPILFITTPGADPSSELRDFGGLKLGADKYKEIAMGQGQGDLAIEMLKQAAASGGWICLQNVHLVIGWVKQLEKELNSLNPNPGFRLWLTSEAHLKFPPSLLSKCLKVTVESPPGVKKNLKIIYDTWTPQFISQGSVARSQALFSLAWFHAVIQERRNYIPQGWNKFYEFSAADLRSGAELLTKLFSGDGTLHWEVVHGILMNAIYGGRIDDPQDYLKLETYLKQYFNNDVVSIDGRAPLQKISKAFALPRTSEIDAYRMIINELPATDNVTMFGLPANIDRTYQNNTSSEIISKLEQIQLEDSQSRKYNKDEWNQQILPIIQIWKKLVTGNDHLQKQVTVQADSEPVTSFFELELSNGIKLIQQINNDFTEINKVIRGTSLLSNHTQELGVSFLKDETPRIWLELWEGPEKLQVYLENVIKKALAISEAREKVLANTFFTASLSLDIFFHPITFLNALRQQTSRKLKRPMDSLRLMSEWSSAGLSSPLKVTVEGLLIQGCRFDGANLSEVESDDPIFAKVPTFQLGWVPEESAAVAGRLSVPLYSTPSREGLVANLSVPVKASPAPWILAGVSFFVVP